MKYLYMWFLQSLNITPCSIGPQAYFAKVKKGKTKSNNKLNLKNEKKKENSAEKRSKERKKKWKLEKENMTLIGSKLGTFIRFPIFLLLFMVSLDVREPERKKEGGEDDIAGLLVQITRIYALTEHFL
ncbi:hypothetical protein TRV_03508 [Trichophyton verrucosum HKI 0517]|uniref:Uncharacterized protein n=1 Tax=Trichophyton verrucosum (strain HKI 0517) TaxID=663202 RepID=D4D8S0_TRIVH|nr:uncharacterized protein TRV_03508 [Trichophyton verrucosum HKI 0517]EFE41752.1 hypothetical protein TRV_03508 [Trichophyton verrucosum HKI 0517]